MINPQVVIVSRLRVQQLMFLLVSIVLTCPLAFGGEREGPYCGIYAMYGAASALGEKRPFEELIDEQFVSGFHGSTAGDLEKCAEKLGVKSRLLTSLGPASLRSAQEPLILHVARFGFLEKYNHWLLFLGMEDQQTCRIADEAGKVTHVPLADVLAQWDGSAILVSKSSRPVSNVDQPEFASFAAAALGMLGLLGLSTWSHGVIVERSRLRLMSVVVFGSIVLLPFLVDAASPAGLLRNAQLSSFIYRALRPREFAEVGADEVRELVKKSAVQVIDARYPNDFGYGHISGAISIPVNASYGEFLNTTKRLKVDKPIVIYCQSAGCKFSDHVAIALVSQGFEDIRIFRGG